ncbi:MAG: ABC transporter ATP-binding protein [Alphaproteobacteria bacterium]|nr:ABC transporter ATP-binding protein [Alphaproteobacteria bacterium]MBV9371262.1 ABC transporter ATP-binding protein [Alphaproteobacteria bacterium]MBV9902799.1 ABC transporter ATP-binding protein [Alphaproteobacteria bacterium]
MSAFRLMFALMSRRRRVQLALTLLLMLLAAAAELLAIGATMPFLALLTGQEPARIGRLPGLLAFHGRPFLFAVLLLVGAAVSTAAIRLLLLWTGQRFVTGLGHDVATAIFARTLRQPYAEFVRRNSSEVLAGMEKVRDMVGSVFQPAMQGVTGTVLALCIGALLFAIDPFAASIAAASVAAVYVAISLATRARLQRNSRAIAETAVSRTKILQEGMGGIRDIILEGSQPVFEAKFRRIDLRFRRAIAGNALISQGPRFLIEAAGMVAIALIAVGMSLQPGGLVKAIPVLGALALGAQRLLPLLQQMYNGWSLVLGNLQSVRDVAALVRSPLVERRTGSAAPLPFERDIVFDRVGFRYAGGGFALGDVSLAVRRGEKIGIVGPTGGGKSSLLDLLMGLIDPDEGEIRIDGRRLDAATRGGWQAQLAHVPQSIYLADDSIAANIAFGLPPERIDRDLIAWAGRAARLDGFVASLERGYETLVGERGIRLSGGQRQRIGIARALYRKARVLILDEATSALDDETEAQVIESIMGLEGGVTLIMIAHRRSTLAGCDRLFRVEKGRVVELSPPRPQAREAGA